MPTKSSRWLRSRRSPGKRNSKPRPRCAALWRALARCPRRAHPLAAQEAQVKAKEKEVEVVRVLENEKRLTAQHETQQQAQRAEYQDKLARSRYNEQLQQQQQMNERERQVARPAFNPCRSTGV